jgi:broad specificity phosphatase PhoE
VSGTASCRMFLLRHGRAEMPDEHGRVWNYSDAALADAGRRRAAELGAALSSVPLDAVFTSDLRRARETAEAIASPQAAPVVPDARLRELNIGDFEGMTLPRLRQIDGRFLPWLEIYFEGRHAGPDFHVPADLAWPGGESVAGTHRRTLPAFLDIAREWQGRTVAVCTHAYVLQAFLCHVVDLDVSQYWTFAGLNASLTLVEVGPDGRGVVRTLNGDLGLDMLVNGRLPLRGQEEMRSAGDSPKSGPGSGDLRSTCRVFLARHGQSMAVEEGEPVYSHHPMGLTPEGRRQSQHLASTLAPVRLDAVYTSDLNRARETAEPLAAVQGLEPVVLPELREISLGDFEGMTLARVHAEQERFIPWLEVSFNDRFPSEEFHHPAELVFPGGESVLAVYERVMEPFQRIVRAHLGGTIAVVSHGWVLQPLLCHVLGAPAHRYFRLQLRYAAPALVEVDANGHGVLEVLNGGTNVRVATGAGQAPSGRKEDRI